MGTDLLAGSEPIADLVLIHQGHRHISGTLLPFIGFAYEFGNEEHQAAKALALQHRKSMVEHVPETVVEGEEYAEFSAATPPGGDRQRRARESRGPQFTELSVEEFGADIKALEADLARARPHVMISQNRVARLKNLPERTEAGIVMRQGHQRRRV